MKVQEFRLQLPSLELAVRSWGSERGIPVLALHGWLDNAASFNPVAEPLLKECSNLRLMAIDIPGHGYSDHNNKGDKGSLFVEHISTVFETLDALGLEQSILLGHSMGGGIALLAAGTFPKRISHLILVDSGGPLSGSAKQAPFVYRTYFEQVQDLRARSKTKLYPHLRALIRARAQVGKFSEKSASILIRRNIKANPQGYSLNYDPSLRLPPSMLLTEQQVCAFIKDISAPTLLLAAKEQMYPQYMKTVHRRMKYFQDVKARWDMPGGHHLHMEAPHETALEIAKWLKEKGV